MQYSSILSNYISTSRMTLQEIEDKMKGKGFSTNKAYISKLQNGKLPPAGEDITRALAEVTGGDVNALLLAGYIEKAPEEIQGDLLEYNAAHRLLKNESLQSHSLAAIEAIRNFKNTFLTSGTIDESSMTNMLKELVYFDDIEIDEDLIRSNPFGASEFLSNRITKRLEEFYAANTNYSARVDLTAYNSSRSDITENKQEYEDDETSKNRKDLIEMIKKASEEDLPDLKILVKRFIKE